MITFLIWLVTIWVWVTLANLLILAYRWIADDDQSELSPPDGYWEPEWDDDDEGIVLDPVRPNL